MVCGARFRQLQALPSLTDYTRLLDSCIRSKALSPGKLIHQHLLKTHTAKPKDTLTLPLEKLTRLYLSCNELHLARQVFERIPHPPRDIILWNLLVRGYAWNGPFEECIYLYYKMLEFGITPNKFTFPLVLKACSALHALETGREMHGFIKRLELESDVYVSTALVDMYAKCGCLEEAKIVFDKMTVKDVVSWNSMISGVSLYGGCYNEVVELVVEMQKDMRPNASTVVGLLPAVAQVGALRHGKEIHGFCVRRSFLGDVVVGTAILDMYGKCKYVDYARRVFDRMIVVTNEVTWSAMIGGYVLCDLMTEALELFHVLMRLKDDAMMILSAVTVSAVLQACSKLTDLSRGRCLHSYIIKSGFVSDLKVGNTLVSVYAKCGMIDDALRFFEKMDLKDSVSYGAVISGCVQNGDAEMGLLMFHKMQLYGLEPDLTTMVSILSACSHLAALGRGSCSHSYAVARGLTIHTTVCNAIIDMYAKCGRIDAARKVFDRMDKRDIVSWNTMIISYGVHGHGVQALSLFHAMQVDGLKSDDVTFICLLSACSHSGLVREGKYWFNAITQDFGIIPRMEHYICMVDLLSRAALFDEVQGFIENMPFEPDVRIWSALLAACRVHKNIELGEEVSQKIQSLGNESTGNFVLLSNMYSAVGRWNDAAQVRIMQWDQGFKKSPGCSWIEIGGIIHGFVGGDRSHPQFSLINSKLEELLGEMKRLGYCAESSYVLQDVEEEEKEQALLYHSEKLAIAFGILSEGPSKPILVTKNLRVCGDCHTAIKFISLITKRVITVRDASRFHHFRDGICNCRDFW